MKIKSQKDFFSGLLFMGLGAAFAWGAADFKIGDSARMEPGCFPMLLSHGDWSVFVEDHP